MVKMGCLVNVDYHSCLICVPSLRLQPLFSRGPRYMEGVVSIMYKQEMSSNGVELSAS